MASVQLIQDWISGGYEGPGGGGGDNWKVWENFTDIKRSISRRLKLNLYITI